MKRRFAELSVEDVRALITPSSIIVLPVGAVEAHGPHLPLSTDLVIASAAVDALMEQAGERLDLWALPTLAVTKSNEHAWAPGTLWLSASTMLAVLEDLGRSLATTAAKTLVFVNGHGGNSALLQVASRDLRLATVSKRSSPIHSPTRVSATRTVWPSTVATMRRRSSCIFAPSSWT